jgi:hypothetical protein
MGPPSLSQIAKQRDVKPSHCRIGVSAQCSERSPLPQFPQPTRPRPGHATGVGHPLHFAQWPRSSCALNNCCNMCISRDA